MKETIRFIKGNPHWFLNELVWDMMVETTIALSLFAVFRAIVKVV